jgi:TIGR03009 family protein
MRLYGFVLAALPLAVLPAAAQQAPPAQAAPAAGASALDGYLQRWEQEMQKVQTLYAPEITRIDKDLVADKPEKLVGYAAYMKSGTGASALNLAVLELRPEGKRDFKEKFVCTGTFLYQFLPEQKEIKVFELPKPKAGQVADDNLLSFLFGMRAEEFKRRFDLKLAKEDQYYVYVDVAPRAAADRSDFQRARVVLNKDSFLPRQLWFQHANGNEVTWDVPSLQNGARLDRRIFDQPALPTGWRMTQAPKPTDAKPVVRPSGQ